MGVSISSMMALWRIEADAAQEPKWFRTAGGPRAEMPMFTPCCSQAVVLTRSGGPSSSAQTRRSCSSRSSWWSDRLARPSRLAGVEAPPDRRRSPRPAWSSQSPASCALRDAYDPSGRRRRPQPKSAPRRPPLPSSSAPLRPSLQPAALHCRRSQPFRHRRRRQ